MAFVRWRTEYKEGFCVVTPPEIDDDYELFAGVSRAKGWPKDITAQMSKKYPKDVALSDVIHGATLVIASKGLKEALDERKVPKIEYLPITILNHKGRVASKDYVILNPLAIVDCIDLDKSGVEWNPIDKTKIMGCKGLVLKAGQVPAELKVFRPKCWLSMILVRRDLADSLVGAKLTGLVFREATGYKGIG